MKLNATVREAYPDLNCPLCGADTFLKTDSDKVYCVDNDCPAHKEKYGLIVSIDAEGIVYLSEGI